MLGAGDVREIAGRIGIRPAKRLGQNFVVEQGTVRRIAALAAPRPGDVILEVNRAAVKHVGAYQAALKTNTKGKIVLLLVRRGDNTIYVTVKPEA